MTKTFNLCGYQVSFKSQAQSSHQQHSNDAPPHSRTNPPVGNQPGLLPSWQGPSPQAPCLQVRYHLHLIIIIGTSFSQQRVQTHLHRWSPASLRRRHNSHWYFVSKSFLKTFWSTVFFLRAFSGRRRRRREGRSILWR